MAAAVQGSAAQLIDLTVGAVLRALLEAAAHLRKNLKKILAANAKDVEYGEHKKLDAAMIKADPKVAPIIAKLEAAHQHHEGPDGPPPPPPDDGKPPAN